MDKNWQVVEGKKIVRTFKLELWTHTANRLTDKNFILAAKTDKLVG